MSHKCNRNSSPSFVTAGIAIVILLSAYATAAQRSTPPDHRAALWQTQQYQPSSETPNSHAPVVSRAQATTLDTGTLYGALPLFIPVVTYDSSAAAKSVVVADLNGDGKADVVVGTANTVDVLLGIGDGTLQTAVKYGAGGDNASDLINESVAIADVNRDGRPDMVVANDCGGDASLGCLTEGTVGVLLGNGDGTFQPVVVVAAGHFPAVAVGDFNADGIPDLTVAHWYQDKETIDVLLGNGSGTFRSPVSYDTGGSGVNSVAIADVNHDGDPDLLVVNACNYINCGNGTIAVLLGAGDGSFQPARSYSSGEVWAVSLAIADVDKNGTSDVVVANWNAGAIGVLLGNGDGSFKPAVIYHSSGLAADFIAVSDVNGDQNPDILVTNYRYGSVDILLGNGNGTFQGYVSQSAPGAHALALADLDGNGSPDLAIAMKAVGVMLHVGDTPTTTALASSTSLSVFGQAVTFTATVSSSSGAPPGAVEFFDHSTALGGAALVNGSSSISIPSLGVGLHEIAAVYQGSPRFKSSASAALNQIVSKTNTTISFASLPNPAGPGQRVTYTARIIGQYGGAATGKVTFQESGSTIGTGTVTANVARYITTYPSLGSHLITAVYSGDTNNRGSTSPSMVEHILNITSMSLTTSGSPTLGGQPVTFSATVTSTYGSIPDGELVTLYDGTIAMASVPLAGGKAAFATSSLSPKTHYIKAVYSGDSTFAAISRQVTQVVQRNSTTTVMLPSSPNPSNYGQAVTWTAVVTSTGPNTPTGTVRFVGAYGTATLNGGTATYIQRWLDAGTHAVTAQYQGDNAFAPSASAVHNQVVYLASTTTTLTSSPNPSSAGQTVTFTAKVKSSTGASPVGTVTFTAGPTVLGTVKIGNSPTSISTGALPGGSTKVEATYNGVLDFAGSTGTTTQTVNP